MIKPSLGSVTDFERTLPRRQLGSQMRYDCGAVDHGGGAKTLVSLAYSDDIALRLNRAE
jgi:hypothetical protein